MDKERLNTGERPSFTEHMIGKGILRAIRSRFKHGPLMAATADITRFSHDYLQRNGVKPAPPIETLPDISDYVPESQQAADAGSDEEGEHA